MVVFIEDRLSQLGDSIDVKFWLFVGKQSLGNLYRDELITVIFQMDAVHRQRP